MNCEYLDSFPYLKRKISNINNRSLSPEETNTGECSISWANPGIRQHTVGEGVVFTVLCVAVTTAVPEFALSWNLTCKPSLVWSYWRSSRLPLRWTCKSSRSGNPLVESTASWLHLSISRQGGIRRLGGPGTEGCVSLFRMTPGNAGCQWALRAKCNAFP